MTVSSNFWIYPISCIVLRLWILPHNAPVPFEVRSNGYEAVYLPQLMIADQQRLFLPHLEEVRLHEVVVDVDGEGQSHKRVYASRTHALNSAMDRCLLRLDELECT